MSKTALLALSLIFTLNLQATVVRADSGVTAAAPVIADFVLFSIVRVKPDRVVDFKQLVLPYAAETRLESGSAGYFVHQSPEDSTLFETYEHWRSDADRAAHLAEPYTVQFFKQAADLFEPGYPQRSKFIELR